MLVKSSGEGGSNEVSNIDQEPHYLVGSVCYRTDRGVFRDRKNTACQLGSGGVDGFPMGSLCGGESNFS